MRRAIAALLRWIESESIRPPQIVVYVGTICAGIQSAIMNPPTTVTRVMGEHVDAIWTAMLIVCPLLACIGMWRARSSIAGLWLLLAGDIGVLACYLAYIAAIVQSTWARSATFAAWLAAEIALCVIGVLVRDVLLLRAVTVRMHELDCEGDGCR